MKCPDCNFENKPGARFCGQCGAPLSEGLNEAAMTAELFQAAEPEASVTAPIKEEPVLMMQGEKKTGAAKKILVRTAAVIVLAAAGGGGLLAGRLLHSEEAAPLITYQDDYSMTVAVGYIYDGVGMPGTLELIGVRGESLAKAANVVNGEFVVFEKYKQLLYRDGDGRLCLQKFGSEVPDILAETVDWSLVTVSDGKDYFAYISQNGASNGDIYIYDLKEGSKERAGSGEIASDIYLDGENKDLYYVNQDRTLIRLNGFQEKQRLKGDVQSYAVLPDQSVFYTQDGAEGMESGILREEEDDKLKVIPNMDGDREDVFASGEAGKVVFFLGREGQEENTDLYVSLPGQKEELLFQDVARIRYGAAERVLYFLDTDGGLYQVSVPKLADKLLEDGESLKESIKGAEKKKLDSSAVEFCAEKNGAYAVWLNEDRELLYQGKEDEEKQKIANGVEDCVFSQQSLTYTGEDGESRRFIFHDQNPAGVLADGDSITLDGAPKAVSRYGDYQAAVNPESGSLTVYDRVNSPITVVPDVAVYDEVWINDQEAAQTFLSYKEIVGSYYDEDEDRLITFTEDGKCQNYENAELVSTVDVVPQELSRFEILLSANGVQGQAGTFAKVSEEGKYSWYSEEDGIFWDLERKNSGQVASIQKRQQVEAAYQAGDRERKQIIEQAEEQVRQEEERLRQEEEAERQKRVDLNSRANYYYRNGIYLYTNTQLYNSYSFSSDAGRHLIVNKNFPVYTYQIDYDAEVIWLKINVGGSGYFWVYTY